MIAHFYIIDESFADNTLSNEDFFSSLSNLIGEYYQIAEYKVENKIYIQQSVFDVKMPDGTALSNFLFTENNGLTGKAASLKKTLSNILLNLENKNINLGTIKTEISCNSIDNCTGVISLSKIDGLANENQIVYDKGSWFKFRRHHLGKFFGQAKYFIAECKKYFPGLFFHENNLLSVDKILDDFASKIVKNLDALNDLLPQILIDESYGNHTKILNLFSNRADLDEVASVEGKGKKRLKFSFENAEGKTENLVCEPHLKLSQNDRGDSKYFYNRIYFHFGKTNIEKSKILIAHIGEHL